MTDGQAGATPEAGASGPEAGGSPPRRIAAWLADREALPTALRAVLDYYARSGVFDVGALRLRGRVEDEVDAIVDDAFDAVEDRLCEVLDVAAAEFDYDTKLTMPVELTLGYCYRSADDGATRERAEAVARLVTEALLDGDMRDAINDAEYEDFEYDLDGDDPGPERVAAVAQACLRERVEAGFAEYPDGVREAYEHAVAVSERHQDDDARFRALLAAARGDEVEAGTEADGETAGDADAPVPDDPGVARERIREEYKHAEFEDPPDVLGERERALPYCRTQYERVGVIYAGMIDMFRAAGLPVEESFERSIVLSIVGAQVWLDDVDDFEADMAEGQLTPVTAEYLLADDDRAAYEAVLDVTGQYLDAAARYATESDSALTGIAARYIYRSGDPEVLPGSR